MATAQPTKKCTKCQTPKILDEYYDDKRASDGKVSRCKSCLRTYQTGYRCDNRETVRQRNRKWYAAHPRANAAHARASNARRKAKQVELLGIFRATGCILCPEKDSSCLDAHHLDPAAKDFSVGQGRRFGVPRLKAELAKCVCVCANCHRKLHAGKLQRPPGRPLDAQPGPF